LKPLAKKRKGHGNEAIRFGRKGKEKEKQGVPSSTGKKLGNLIRTKSEYFPASANWGQKKDKVLRESTRGRKREQCRVKGPGAFSRWNITETSGTEQKA